MITGRRSGGFDQSGTLIIGAFPFVLSWLMGAVVVLTQINKQHS